MKVFIPLIFLAIAVYVPRLQAQCATGQNTGGQCIPPDALKPPPDSNQYSRPQQPPAVWADQWGAIATDVITSAAGTTEGQPTKIAAEKIALSICASHGSPHCEMRFTFHNQCAAAALGSGQLGIAGAPNYAHAEELAIAKCGHIDTCKIVYSACSLPVRVQ